MLQLEKELVIAIKFNTSLNRMDRAWSNAELMYWMEDSVDCIIAMREVEDV